MWQMAYASVWTAALAVVGWYMGSTVHGPSVQAMICAAAGGAGGFGIAAASLGLAQRLREQSGRTAADPG